MRKDRKSISALTNLCKHKADNTFKEKACVLPEYKGQRRESGRMEQEK